MKAILDNLRTRAVALSGREGVQMLTLTMFLPKDILVVSDKTRKEYKFCESLWSYDGIPYYAVAY
jgi:hypothetical protein